MQILCNGYTFRQDSSFLYYFGQERTGLAGVIDSDTGKEWLLGNDIDIDDIIWTGFVPSVADLAAECGVSNSAPFNELTKMLGAARKTGRKIHFLPPYRHDHMILISDLLDIHPLKTPAAASVELINAVVDMRSIKSQAEIDEIERAMAIGYRMHTAAMKACKPSVTEKSIAGLMEGIAAAEGAKVSFSSIVTMHGEIFHGSVASQLGRPPAAGRCRSRNEQLLQRQYAHHAYKRKFTQKQRKYTIVEPATT